MCSQEHVSSRDATLKDFRFQISNFRISAFPRFSLSKDRTSLRTRTYGVPRKTPAPPSEIVSDPVESAKIAGLRYVSDAKPGITRKRNRDSWDYFLPDGRKLRDHNELVRIKRLGIPPAWTDVWICPHGNGHLQATGRDARGRKQYRYHSRWREVRDETKYHRMLAFAEALPRIRKRVEADLALPGLPKNKVLATVVRLMERTLIRVGNDEYARDNKSYGLTTIRNHHAKVDGAKMTFKFKGKSGKMHEIDVRDRRVAKIVSRCQDLPGHELFAYVDEEGNVQDIGSDDVNAYLREITGEDFTAKDFRTWAGTVLAALALREFEKFNSSREAKRNITRAIEAVAQMLGNTPAICKKCYVHPEILNGYLDGTMIETLQKQAERKISESLSELKPEEAAVVMLLQQRLAAAQKAA
jgi:DNA topoisomerase-1